MRGGGEAGRGRAYLKRPSVLRVDKALAVLVLVGVALALRVVLDGVARLPAAALPQCDLLLWAAARLRAAEHVKAPQPSLRTPGTHRLSYFLAPPNSDWTVRLVYVFCLSAHVHCG